MDFDINDLTTIKWRHMEYLIKILYFFCIYINTIRATIKDPIIQEIFRVYNKLFEYLKK